MQKSDTQSKVPLLVSLTGALLLSALFWAKPGYASYVGTPYTGERETLFDLHVGLAYYDVGMAAGGRFGIPILDNGFIPSINNAVYITFGVDYYLMRYQGDPHGALGIPIALHWEFYFSEKWSAYGEAGVNIFFHPSVFQRDGWTKSPEHWIAASAGGRYHINKSVALTLHVGNPYSAFGVVFKF